jgi:hypothetical protein
MRAAGSNLMSCADVASATRRIEHLRCHSTIVRHQSQQRMQHLVPHESSAFKPAELGWAQDLCTVSNWMKAARGAT